MGGKINAVRGATGYTPAEVRALPTSELTRLVKSLAEAADPMRLRHLKQADRRVKGILEIITKEGWVPEVRAKHCRDWPHCGVCNGPLV